MIFIRDLQCSFMTLKSWSVQFSRSVISDSLRPHGLQHTRLPCPSPTPRVYSNSCPLSRWYHPTISSSFVPFSCLQSFRVFSSELALHISYWSFSFNISPSHEYSGLISFRMDWLDLKKLITGPQSPHRVFRASPLCRPRLMLQPRNCFCILMMLLLPIGFSLPGTPLPASPHVQPPGP